ncbi:hypothetical protein ACWD5Q_06670 [Streptomyces sp. NPDC002513]
MARPTVSIDLHDQAAADLIEALRGQPPRTEADAQRRERLADQLDKALFACLIKKDT